ncbi:low-density lipoprotein receptor-related protein 4 isoform X2 [Aethina tumida]|uniref:low-density lipoprotein receptor-related protein 4 isoform X2 n=1 Tax=Aethina tumida TaxID=116153 RepID=UPI002147245E|nr:low-density lipoprotein receptor-related protein 4 isoform X2 [Aethina tumida]
MLRIRGTPISGCQLILLCLIFTFVSCQGEIVTSPTTPPHRGAARLKYGSGSLRPPGSKPIYATGQRDHGVRTTLSPALHNHNAKSIPILYQYPFVPYAIPIDPIYFNRDLMTRLHPKIDNRGRNRGGMYGGRPEYSNGRPNHGIINGRFPFDLGFLPGKGYEPNIHVPLPKYLPPSPPRKELGPPDHEPKPDVEDEAPKVVEEHPCGEPCGPGEFLCLQSCICIKDIYRCDGDADCQNYEDELECGEMLSIHNDKCNESQNYVRCPKTNNCISKDWLCDGDDDCGDFSDETHCGVPENCTSDQFQCENGLCIPKNWICDNDNDCKDFSDEINCKKIGCNEHEFECGDSSCISASWKCDKQIDCMDGSDENDCDILPPFCNDEEFQCTNKMCIKKAFKCDGDDDCEDWSDENDCPKIQGVCVSGEYKCKSGRCIPERYKCDKQQDCDDNDDEENCQVAESKTCSPDSFTCDNGVCILHTWRCDGFHDCTHGEDEANCEIKCDESKFPCSGPGPHDNSTYMCINKKHVCDGYKDCAKGEDEGNCPTKRECEPGTKCKQLCITTKDGKNGCSCLPGYYLAKDGYSCEDIDECMYATDPVCSQTCNNTIGSFRCGCMTGYVLRPDLRSCKAVGAPPTLLFANRIDIRQVSLSNNKYTAILKGLHNAIALDYHYEKKYIFWSDVSMDVIRRAYVNGSGVTDIIKWGLEAPGGVALDWIHDLLFWTDSGTRRIEVASLDGQQRAIIIANEIDKPRAIVVHPGEALIFWTDWGPNPKIERAEMDGSNRRSIITESVFWPNGLTLDYTSSRIYWADAKHNVIETSLLDGTDRKKVISKGLPHPFAITIFEDAIYWTDWHTKSISTANKATGAGLKTIHSQLHFPMDIHSYHPQRQPKYRNRCGNNNGGCEHMCIPNIKSYTCVCRMGQKLKNDRKSCQKPDKLLLFARKKDLRLKHLDPNPSHQLEMVIPVNGIKSAVAIAWDSKTDYIYWTDVERDAISRALWNGSNQEVLVHTNIITPAGLALDWCTDKIYWTDADTARIEVAKANGEMRSLLIWEDLDKPRDIVVDPIGGYMYWSDWGDKPKIERADMDGKNRLIIASTNLTWPNGLAVDHSTGKIYWTDAGSNAIEFANFDGSDRRVLLSGIDLPHPFGLDVFGNNIYWSDWQNMSIEKANKLTGQNRTILSTSMNGVMDVRVFHRNRKNIRSSCNNNNGGCSHLCLLRSKSHSCACPTGIKLGDDGKTCANGPKNFLIMARRVDIRQISLDVPYMVDVVLPLPKLKLATSVDVDRKTGEIYWTDTAEDVIQKSTPEGKHVETIVMHEMEATDGFAIDSTGRKMYWTDGERNSIEVAELDGTNRKVLIWENLDNPRAITLHYHHGLMFWSDWGTAAKIEVAHMDGKNRQTIVSTNLSWPNGLAIDRPANRLYWNDGKLHTIESSDLNGKNRRVLIRDVSHPYGLVVVGNHVYWTDWKTQALHRAEKINGTDNTKIKQNLEGLMDVRSVQSDNIAENACGENNGGCSHLCLRNPTSFTCSCPTGIRLTKNNPKQCESQPSTYLLVATGYTLSRISLDTDDVWDYTLQIEQLQNAVDVDFHWEKKKIFFTDIEQHLIQVMSMQNFSDIKPIVQVNLSSPGVIAVDWLADNIYFTNTGNKIIEVARLDGSSRKTIIKRGLQDPRSVAVFPRKGYLYWSDWGSKPKIERSFLDGSSRKTIVDTDLSLPIGLVVDYLAKRLYWIDAKMNAEKIETSDLHGENRVLLNVQGSPFSLTQFGDHIYWTDWKEKSVNKADKTTGKDAVIVRPHLDATMGLTMVTQSRQMGWNPCAINNGGCAYLCLFKQKNYTCACPDNRPNCKPGPSQVVSIKCPGEKFKCDYDDDDETDSFQYDIETGDDYQKHKRHPNVFYVITLVPMLSIILICSTFFAYLFVRKGKKKYMYAASRSFSNPNYYSSNNEPGRGAVGADRKQLWKRLKYDKSQERVYEETTTNSPEITSLIPTILTPCSSNCETVTPELERSPSVTPLHKSDIATPTA